MKAFKRAAVVALLISSRAFAAPSADEVERARTYFNAGAQAYSAAKYADAVRSFEQAYALAPRPPVLFSLAQAERKAFLDNGDSAMLKHAIQHYGDYLTAVPTGGRSSEAQDAKKELEARLARMDPKDTAPAAPPVEKKKPRVTVFSPTQGAQVSIDGGPPSDLPYFADLEPGKHKVRVFGEGYFDAEQEISGDKGQDVPVDLTLKEKPALVSIALDSSAEVYVDGRLVAETPLTRPIEVASGPHVIAIAKNGKKAWSQEVELARAKTMTLEPKLATSTQRIASLTMMGVGGASVVAGGVSMILAFSSQSKAQDLNDKRTKSGISPSELSQYNRKLDDRDAERTAAWVFGAAGAAVLAGGALFYVFDRPPIALVPQRVEPPPKPAGPVDIGAVKPVPLVGPGLWGAGITALW